MKNDVLHRMMLFFNFEEQDVECYFYAGDEVLAIYEWNFSNSAFGNEDVEGSIGDVTQEFPVYIDSWAMPYENALVYEQNNVIQTHYYI